MCSMVACLTIPCFSLRVALDGRHDLRGRSVALAPSPGAPEEVGACTAAALDAGVRPGMRLAEALAVCPSLVLLEADPSHVDERWEQMLRRLEQAGLAVDPDGQGCVYFHTDGVERLAGGLQGALRRALDAIGARWEPRVGAASRRFAALAAASVAPAGGAIVVDDGQEGLFLEPLPVHLLPLSPARRRELSSLGIRRIGDLARLPHSSVGDRFGSEVAGAWRLAHGEGDAPVSPRCPAVALAESLRFPEPVANILTLEHALTVLIERLLRRPERAGREPRSVRLIARIADGGSWRQSLTLREPTAETDRIRTALVPRLAGLPGPVLEVSVALEALTRPAGAQGELIPSRGSRLLERLRDGLAQVREAAGADAVCTVVEVAPWSRIPESRAILVPRAD